MTSTRNKNTPGNYCLSQRDYDHSRQYVMYENSAYGYAYDTKMPGNGLNPGQFPVSTLSENPINIESFLWGINSVNLTNTNPNPVIIPELKCLPSVNLYKNVPTLMPDPMVILKKQRPNIMS